MFEVSHASIDAVTSQDNRGSRYVGPWQSVIGANLNSVAAHPGYTLKEMVVRSRSNTLGLGISHPKVALSH